MDRSRLTGNRLALCQALAGRQRGQVFFGHFQANSAAVRDVAALTVFVSFRGHGDPKQGSSDYRNEREVCIR